MPDHQYSLSLIPHKVNDNVIEQRAADGYINATAMCKACDKLMADYLRLKTTSDFLAALSSDMGIPISELNQVVKGGDPTQQGTWVHPQVAIHLAQWLSPKFAVMVSKWVVDWMSGKVRPGKLPYHLERHVLNNHKVPSNKFSVLQEMAIYLLGPMESHGYTMPENLMPDISQAKMLCKELRETLGVDTKSVDKYTHTFPDGREVEANLYDIEHLPLFRKLMAERWMPQKAVSYFKPRDPAALPVLDKMLLLTSESTPQKPAAIKRKHKKSA